MPGKFGFKFEIGEFVKPLGTHVDNSGDRLWQRRDEQRWIVCERILQECPGGVQRHYHLQGVSPNGSVTNGCIMMLEQCLEQSEPFPAPVSESD